MSEHVPEPKLASVPEPTEDPWRVAFVEFKTRDENMVKDFKEEIDTLLVFVRRPHLLFILGLTTLTSQAGLFSAVLTAFVVESYQSLQEDYTQTSVDLLRHISHQLANSSVPAASHSSQFQAQRSDVRVNVCWFVSLLLSLVVALFGIFLKQWMRTYMKWTDVTPDRKAVAFRQIRYRALESWRLGAILTLLPTLLQLSVILFLSGLLIFLWHLDRMVADVMAVLLTVTFFLVVTVTALPAVSRSCPYRSPLSEIIAVSLWRVSVYAHFLRSAIWAFIRSGWTYSPYSGHWKQLADRWRNRSKVASWAQADEDVIAQYNNNEAHVSMHVGAMVHLCCTTQSQPLWSAAIAAIVAEFPTDTLISTRGIGDGDLYYSEVWWPLLGHMGLFTERELESPDVNLHWSELVLRASSAFMSLSSSMKQSWVIFLSHSKSLVCLSRPTRVVESYMMCCIASIESTKGGPCMQAFMEVLEAQYENLQESQLDGVACLLAWNRGLAHDVLLDSLSGLSFPVRMVS
jgi:hypothetical protein